jgi:hypothetical protein
MIDLVEFRQAQRLGAAGAMDHMRDILHGGTKALWIAKGAGSHLHVRQVRFDEAFVAGRPEQHGRRDATSAKTVQDVAADEPVGSCQENLH